MPRSSASHDATPVALCFQGIAVGDASNATVAIVAAMRGVYDDDLFVSCSKTPAYFRSHAHQFCVVTTEDLSCYVVAF